MDKLLKACEAAELLNVAESTIYQWTSQGFIPHVKIRNLVRFKAKDLEEWVSRLSTNGRTSCRIDIDKLLS